MILSCFSSHCLYIILSLFSIRQKFNGIKESAP
jgi:hypothetical protein